MKIGIDLGGTKIEGIILSDEGLELRRKRVVTPSKDYNAIIKTIADLLRDFSIKTPSARNLPVGIGIPGALSSATGLVKNANTTCLIGKPLLKDLKDCLLRPIRLANDANCFTVSEATDGAGQGYILVFGVILGTGVGGGLTFNRELWIGPNSISGEWGHNVLFNFSAKNDAQKYDRNRAPLCYCGKIGCIEAFLSGPGLSNDHKLHSGEHASPEEIANAAAQGNPDAVSTLQRYEVRLARALSTVINTLDPDVIVLGGGLSKIDSLYQNVPKLWTNWVFSDTCVTKLVKNLHGDSSGVRGAAWLW